MISKASHQEGGNLLRKMIKKIQHRGPDDEGYFDAVTKSKELYVGLGHCRLSIIDLVSGHQPLSNETGTLQIVFNGEIYNFQDLRHDLLNRGHQFSTNSDTETIIHAYEEFGEDCVTKLRGMFAFAIWDTKKESLFLARDRFGKKPLFLFQDKSNLFFASEIKSVLEIPNLGIRADQESILQFLTYRYVPAPATLFSGVRKLLPGSYAIWENGELREYSYYSPPDQHSLQESAPIEDPTSAFFNHLSEAVKLRMISDVPFGAFLSGGIDSSAIVGLMTQHSTLPIKTFSVGFNETEYSELQYARVIAQHFQSDHHELTISQNHIIDELPSLVRFRDAPVTEASDIPIYLLAKEARKSVKVILTGEGSDEILGGYPKHIFEQYTNLYQWIPTMIRQGLLEPFIDALPYKFRKAKIAISSMGVDDWNERMARWFGASSRSELSKLVALQSNGQASNAVRISHIPQQGSALRRILFFDQTSWLPDNLLERGDRMTMAGSLEARMPFMDHILAQYVSSLPDRYRIRGLTTKWILRQAMKHILPLDILNRPKVGFRVPINDWFRGKMKNFLCDHLLGSDSITKAYYHQTTLNRIVQEHMQSRQNHEKLLWILLNLEIWHREYRIST